MRNWIRFVAAAGAAACWAQAVPAELPPAEYSEHGYQQSLIPPDPSEGKEGAAKTSRAPRGVKQAEPSIETNDFVVMGYVQSNTPRWAYHWHALTHICLPFTSFDSNGDIINGASTITNRSIIYQPDGMADRNGVKVLIALQNSGFDVSIINSVFPNQTRRENLADQVAAYVNDPNDNIAGVNLDIEELRNATVTTAAREGVVDFIVYLRSVLDPGKEISWYVGPTYQGFSGSGVAYPNLDIAAQHLDFFNYSCYPWSGAFSNTSTSINAFTSYRGQVDTFLNNGVPPEKMVLTIGTYGYRMVADADTYGASKVSDISSTGFADAHFQVTLASPQRARQYQTGAESPWYAFSVGGGNFESVMYEDHESHEFKARGALSWHGNSFTGRRLRGVSFWSLAWVHADFLGGFQSRDMEAGTGAVDKIRTYPHIFQVYQDVFAPKGQTARTIEKWEYDDAAIGAALRNTWDRWRDPDEGSDSVGLTSASRSIVVAPAGANAPENSDYCLQLDYTFSATAGNRFFYRWEILGDKVQTSVRDINAARAFFDINSKVQADLHTSAAYANATIRFVVMDANGELEMSPQISLNATGWRTIEWDLLNEPASAYTTSFNQYLSGDGTLDTAGGGAKDLAVIGFLVEGGGASGSGTIRLDELRHAPAYPGDIAYVINEFSHAPNSGEFIEIYGPAGAIPAGVEIRVFSGSSATPVKIVDLSGLVVPANGVVAVGDPSFGGAVVSSAGFSDAVNDLPDTAPAALQLWNSSTGAVYDSVVYRAWGGLGDLIRQQTLGVTNNGYPWIGEIGPGAYSVGRYPDGANGNVNYDDFSVMPLSPGQPNGDSIVLGPSGVTYDFDTEPASAYRTYNWASAGSVAPPVGVGASPSGGNAYRVADSSGGVIGFIGDKALGSDGEGYRVTGELYIQPSTARSQALGIGICGTHGSVFFTGNPAAYGYENGYWLIYHNDAEVTAANGFNNGRDNHAQAFEFVHANHTNMAADYVDLLADATLAATGATAGAWTTFELAIDPVENNLLARINGFDIYDGPIPAGGPISGAFQIGHRETDAGGNVDVDGTWVDNVTIEPINPTGVRDFRVFEE